MCSGTHLDEQSRGEYVADLSSVTQIQHDKNTIELAIGTLFEKQYMQFLRETQNKGLMLVLFIIRKVNCNFWEGLRLKEWNRLMLVLFTMVNMNRDGGF